MSIAGKVLPSPMLSLALLAVWLLLADTVSAGAVILGSVLAIAIPWFTHHFHADVPRVRRPGLIVKLIGVVLWDIVVANVNVARLTLGRPSRLRSAFVSLPLDVRDPYAITALSTIVTLTPGTVSAGLSADRRILTVHVLDLVDREQAIELIKQRYEAPLREIFQCSSS